MKKLIALFLALLMALSLCACGDTESFAKKSVPAENSDGIEAAPEEENISGSRFYKGVELPDYVSDHQIAEMDAIDQYIDNQKYLKGNGPKLDYVIDEVVVYNTCLKIGMSYDEVISAGLTPTEEDFADTETGLLAYVGQFTDSDGNLIRLGFIGDEGKTVADGVLYSVSGEDNAEYKVGPCVVPCSISDLLDALGEPYDLAFGVYSDILDMKMNYRSQERDVYLTFNVNLETGEVFDLTLEGYSD